MCSFRLAYHYITGGIFSPFYIQFLCLRSDLAISVSFGNNFAHPPHFQKSLKGKTKLYFCSKVHIGKLHTRTDLRASGLMTNHSLKGYL